MKRDRLLIVSAVVLVAGVSLVATRWRLWTDARPFVPTAIGESEPSLTIDLGDLATERSPPELLSDVHHVTAPAYLGADLHGGTVHADAETTVTAMADNEPPATLPAATSAIPIDLRTANEARELEELIAAELADYAEADRQVWRDVLQGLSVDEAREILGIWKSTAGGASGEPHPLLTPGSPRQPEIESPPATAEQPGVIVSPERLGELHCIQSNLRHVETPGYRRQEVIPAAEGGVADGNSPAIVTRLDLAPGEYRATNNPLDVAIAGPGWIALRQGDERAYTRAGHFDLSATGELIQKHNGGIWSLDPPVQLSSDTRSVTIHENGGVFAHYPGQTDPVECGRISLVDCLNPQRLQPLAGALVQPTSESGAMHPVEVDGLMRLITQGSLERSNATVEVEGMRLEQLLEAERLLQQVDRLVESSTTDRR